MEKILFFNHLTKDLIPFWNKMADFEHGGFYGYADNLAKIDKAADKSIILQNRIMWFYSNSYLLLKNPSLLSYAKHSFEFFKKYSFDKKRGGVYWSTDYLGNSLPWGGVAGVANYDKLIELVKSIKTNNVIFKIIFCTY